MGKKQELDVTIAKKAGVRPALIYEYLCWCLRDKKMKNEDYLWGSYWVTLSLTDLEKEFPYINKATIANSLNKLTKMGLIMARNVEYDKRFVQYSIKTDRL